MAILGSNYGNIIGYKKDGYNVEPIHDSFYFLGKKYNFRGTKSEINKKLEQMSKSRIKSMNKKNYYKVFGLIKRNGQLLIDGIFTFPKSKSGKEKAIKKQNQLKNTGKYYMVELETQER